MCSKLANNYERYFIIARSHAAVCSRDDKVFLPHHTHTQTRLLACFEALKIVYFLWQKWAFRLLLIITRALWWYSCTRRRKYQKNTFPYACNKKLFPLWHKVLEKVWPREELSLCRRVIRERRMSYGISKQNAHFEVAGYMVLLFWAVLKIISVITCHMHNMLWE